MTPGVFTQQLLRNLASEVAAKLVQLEVSGSGGIEATMRTLPAWAMYCVDRYLRTLSRLTHKSGQPTALAGKQEVVIRKLKFRPQAKDMNARVTKSGSSPILRSDRLGCSIQKETAHFVISWANLQD